MERDYCWRTAYAIRKGELPPDTDPRTCFAPRPETSWRVAEVVQVLQLAWHQQRTSFGGTLGTDWNVIKMLVDDFGIDANLTFWELMAHADAELRAILNKPADKAAGGVG